MLGCSAAGAWYKATGWRASRELVQRFGCVGGAQGSGSVVAAPRRCPLINPTGIARLATGPAPATCWRG
jgi:hypothetical protein